VLFFGCLLFLTVVVFVVDFFFLNNDQNIKKREVIASGLFTIKRVKENAVFHSALRDVIQQSWSQLKVSLSL